MFDLFKRKSKNTAFTFTHHRTLSDIQESWNAVLPDNHHLLSCNLYFLENNTNIQGHYIKVYKDEEHVGNIYLQKIKVPINNLGYPIKNIKKLECLINSINGVNCTLDFLVCGNIYRPNQEGYFFKNDIVKEEVFNSFIDFTEDLEKTIGFAGILIKECASPLASEGKFTPIKQDVSMEMSINPEWLTVNDYVEDLDKKYRKRFLKIQQSGSVLEKRELSQNELLAFQKQMFELYNQVYSTQDFKLTEISESYFVNLKQVLGEKMEVFGFFKNDELLAFTTHIYNAKRQMEIHYIGIAYNYNKEYNLYFNILQFGLEMAIKDRQQSLELGRTAHVAKASLGAKPTPNYNYVYFKKQIYSWSFQLFLRKMYKNIESDWQTRSPFSAGVQV